MYDVNLTSVVSLNDINDNPNYDSMSLEDIMAENNQPTRTCATMENIRMEKNYLPEDIEDAKSRLDKGFSLLNILEAEIKELTTKGNGIAEEYRCMYEKWNAFLNTDQYKYMPRAQKNVLWDRYKTAIASKKNELASSDVVTSALIVKRRKYWDRINQLRDWLKNVPSWAWARYFAVMNEETATRYFTCTGDVQENADQEEIFMKTGINLWDEYRDAHLAEMDMDSCELSFRQMKEEDIFTEVCTVARSLGI